MRLANRKALISHRRRVRRKTQRLALLILLTSLGAVIAWFVLTLPYFCITKIEVEGQEKLSKDTILKQAAIPKQRSIFRVDLTEISRRIAQASRVKKAEVRRVFPSTLLILVQERVPFAYLKKRAHLWEVDEEGVVIGEAAKKQDLPLITGSGVSRDQTEKIELGVKILASFQELGLPLERLNIANENSIVGDLEKGPQVYLTEDGYFDYVDYLPLVLADAKKKDGRIKYVDLRFREQIVVGYE